MTCKACNGPISKHSASGYCKHCVGKSPETRARKSAGVRKMLANNPGELERRRNQARSLAADPENVAQKTVIMRATFALPEVRAKHSRIAQATADRRRQDPATVAGWSRWGREHGSRIGHAITPEIAAKISNAHLAWCPVEYRDLNAKLKANGYRLPERKAMIAETVRTAPTRAIREVDRQMREREARRKAQEY